MPQQLWQRARYVTTTFEGMSHLRAQSGVDMERSLRWSDLVKLRIDGMVGIGVFMATCRAVRLDVGPAIVISYAIFNLHSLLSAFCYTYFTPYLGTTIRVDTTAKWWIIVVILPKGLNQFDLLIVVIILLISICICCRAFGGLSYERFGDVYIRLHPLTSNVIIPIFIWLAGISKLTCQRIQLEFLLLNVLLVHLVFIVLSVEDCIGGLIENNFILAAKINSLKIEHLLRRKTAR
ncbi:hypothetical protein ZIOFF_024199 [Zingiber officinale]|uniref:Uncharacterized protein n=1 Tax=Zingiber officinale TaxID=94328 RepID=A0A8J5GRY8_ZINOF|nr:hypothetical protein ZIOFF_024199 [Zingiber officinale]